MTTCWKISLGFIAAAILALPASAQKLEVTDVAFHQFEDGPALRPPAYHDGEVVFVSFLVSGYKANDKDTIQLEWDAEAFDDAGVALSAAVKKKIEAELAPEDKEWKPKVRFQVEAPQTASCEACKIVLRVRDLVAKTQTQTELKFAVRSLRVEPSESLVIRNFRFLRSEEDGKPLAIAAYRPGDEVWGRFEIAGFKTGEKNMLRVEYGLTVYRPSGKLLYQEGTAASAEESSFYAKKWIPGILNLKLDTKLPPGEYPVAIEVRDMVGPQRYESRFTFRIE